MPEWYNWRKMLQRPGQETSTIDDRPSGNYQLQVPEFKFTPRSTEESIWRGTAVRQARDAYNTAYNEYLEQHPLPTGAGIGYNPYVGIQYNPEVQRQSNAHQYAVQQSGYNAEDPTAPYKESDRKFAKFSEGVLGASLFAPEFATYGLLGGGLRVGGGLLGSAVGGYAGSEIGKDIDNHFNTNFWQPTLGIAGGFMGWGKGARFGYNAGLKGIQYGASKGFVPHDWLASSQMKLDALRKAGLNWGPVAAKGAANGSTVMSESGVPMLQSKPLQLISTTARTQFSPINFSLSESYRIPRNKPMVIGPDYKQMFMDWYRQNIKEPNITVDHIKQFVAGLPTKDNELFKRNFNEYIDELTKGNTYHSALGTGDIVNEFQLMSMPERDPEYIDKQDILDFYRTDALPRVLKNIRDAGIDLTSEQIQEITNIYSNPFEGVNSKIRYMPPGVGGFSRGSDEIGYSNRYFDRDVDGNPTSFIDSQTVIHELHHRLRSKLGEYLRSQGIILNLDPPSDPNNPFKRASWTPPLNLSNQSSDLVEYSIRNRSPQTQYTPEEIWLMEPLGMTLKYRKDKTPIAEIGAVSAGNARFKFWQKAKSQVPEGILPTIEQTNSVVNNLPDIDLIDMYRELPYGSQIGSVSMQEADNLRSRLFRRDELYGILTNSRYEKLPFYKKWFVKPITRQFGLFNDRYLPTTDDNIVKIGDEWRSNFAKAIRKAITGIAAVGPVALGTQISKEKQGGIIKRK